MTQILPNPLEGINYLDQYYKVKSMITRFSKVQCHHSFWWI